MLFHTAPVFYRAPDQKSPASPDRYGDSAAASAQTQGFGLVRGHLIRRQNPRTVPQPVLRPLAPNTTSTRTATRAERQTGFDDVKLTNVVADGLRLVLDAPRHLRPSSSKPGNLFLGPGYPRPGSGSACQWRPEKAK